MQMRYNGLIINECLKHLLDREPTKDDHVIIINDDEHKLTIPLELNGVSSVFLTQKPTKEDLKDDLIEWIEMTTCELVWKPYSKEF